MSTESLVERINANFRELADNFGTVGLAWRVLVKDEICSGVCGIVSRENETPLTEDLQWHWGSCAKALTATVVACVIEAGHLSAGWQTQVGEVLTDLKDTVVAPVTLEQLAHHRSGLLEDLDKQEEEELHSSVATSPVPEQRAVFSRRLAEKPLIHPPGERYGPYSNAGFVLLAHVIEVATNTPWETLVRNHVVEPLGMTSFGFGIPEGAIGHDEEDVPQPLAQDKPWLHSSFSVHSTLEDWVKFSSLHLAVLRGEYKEGPIKASPAALERLQTPVSPSTPQEPWDGNEPPNGYAMGWKTQWIDDGEEHSLLVPPPCLWHFGTNFVFNSGIYVDREHGIVAVAGSNSGSMVTRLAIRSAFEGVLEIVSPTQPEGN
jgi:CubicO group peptidase (beta-lactamase class C family)